MESAYNKWLEKEMEWIKQERKQANGRAALIWVAIALICPIISIIFGLASGAPDFWRGAPASLLIGACIGFVTWIGVFFSRAVVRYEKNIQSCLESMTQSDRETMARQMLGEDPEAKEREVKWRDLLEGHFKAHITRDYLTFSGDRGSFLLVHLWKTERIETDVKQITYRASGGGMSMRMSTEVYPVAFYYRGNHTDQQDTDYVFAKSEWRDAVLQAIREVTGD